MLHGSMDFKPARVSRGRSMQKTNLLYLVWGPNNCLFGKGGAHSDISETRESEESNGFQIVSSVAFFSLLVPHFPRANDIRNDVLCAIILLHRASIRVP